MYFRISLIFAGFISLAISAAVREVELSTDWVLTNANGSITREGLKLPSGVYSALFNEDVLKSYNDVNLRYIAYDNWTYMRHFNVTKDDYENVRFVNLTFHGIDTMATIKLNGRVLRTTDNMFVRYTDNINKKGWLKEGDNLLEVVFQSPVHAANRIAQFLNGRNLTTPPECPPSGYHGECHMNLLRKMQASFAWDWGLAAPSMGIWKAVTLEFHDVAVIRDVDTIVSKAGDDWELLIRVFLETGVNEPFYGELIFYAVELLDHPVNISYRNRPLKAGTTIIEFTQKIPRESVILWWPNGYGDQKLYPLHFTLNTWLTPEGPNTRDLSISQKSIRIGFRTIELVQDELGNGYNFYFRVNGVPIFMKGSNYIPSHILPEFSQDQARIKHLLQSAKDTHQNMIRVWGGGIYESDFFYDTCDALGILIWQDMMFACAMYPTTPEFLESVKTETVQNARRIAHHPSIAIFAGNNENEVALAQNWYKTNRDYKRYADEYRELYVGTIYHELRVVSHSSRPDTLISSPSNGIISKSENYLSTNPQNPDFGDIHYYEITKDGWDPNIYPRPRFASEYGFQSLPAMSSWTRVLGNRDNLNDLINHRQHHPAGMIPITQLIMRHLPLPLPGNPDHMEALIYFSQISQAMATKIETEVYRAERGTDQDTMGALYWQLNDVWVAPSWSSIDFFGNYKILHYWAKEFLAPVAIIAHYNSATDSVNVTISREEIGNDIDLHGNVTMNTYLWSDLTPQRQLTWETVVRPNSNQWDKVIKLNDMLVEEFDKYNSFFEFVLTSGRDTLSKTYFFPHHIKSAVGVRDPQISVEIMSKFCKPPLNSYSLSISVNYPAIFVYMEVTHDDVENYKLSKNGFMQLEPMQIVHLEFDHAQCVDITRKNIKILTVNQFMKQ